MENAPEATPQPKEEKKHSQWRDLFLDKFIDLIMVVLGIYIAFQIDNWKEAAGQRSLEKFYFQSILSDLEKDIQDHKRHLDELRSDQHLIRHYLKKKTTTNDSLGYVVTNIFSFETFSGNKNTYLTLLSSNGLSVIQDHRIHSLLTEYYNLYTSIERFDKVYTDLIYKVNDYFIPYINYATYEIVNGASFNKTESANFLLIVNDELTQGIEDYEEVLGRALSLQKDIKEYLKH